jgi:hypothetical protein
MRALGNIDRKKRPQSSPVERLQAKQQGNPKRALQGDRSTTPTITGKIAIGDGYAYPVFFSSSPPAEARRSMAQFPALQRLPVPPGDRMGVANSPQGT